MRVRVYRHLRRLVWSIQDPRTGLVVDHRPELVLVGVALVEVEPAEVLPAPLVAHG